MTRTDPHPKAPKDPTAKRPYFYIMHAQEVYGSPQPDGRGIQFIYEDGRLADCMKRVGNITDEEMLREIPTAAGFKKIVHSIGVSVSEPGLNDVTFALQMYPNQPGEPSTTIKKTFRANGDEVLIELADIDWEDSDNLIGQIRYEFDKPGLLATVDARFYLNDGYTAPEQSADTGVDFGSDNYVKMIGNSLMRAGNTGGVKKLIAKAKAGEKVTLSFIGGSITQGAGATPIHMKSYARQVANAFADEFYGGNLDKVDLIKAGVGGTPSELGMIRFRRDVLRDDTVKPDIVVIEFAVNDEGDETKGACFESLIRKCLKLSWHPAVVLLFSVFSDDYNLQDRLGPIGEYYDIPMVSIKNAVSPQFNISPADGRVISKNQYFYDQFHPSNNGHRIMCDSIMNLFKTVAADVDDEVKKAGNANTGAYKDAADTYDKNWTDAASGALAKPLFMERARFEDVQLLDKKDDPLPGGARVSEGSFTATDNELQCVEMDSEIKPVPEFPNNWHYDGSGDADEPFVMECECTRLLAVIKDSGSAEFGKALISVDGEQICEYDPLAIGWGHCNPIIICDGDEKAHHKVEVKMAPGSEKKKFTILGFGVVE